MAKCVHIFFSPHLDDVVFSCGGLILKLASQKENVIVITLCTTIPDETELPNRFKKYANIEARLIEDRNAMEKLGVNYSYWNFTERLFVKPFVKTPLQVFRSPDEGVTGFIFKEQIKQKIREILEEYPVAKIYIPLGIGNHYDHVQLTSCAFDLQDTLTMHQQFYFYEDAYSWLGNTIRKKHYLAKRVFYEHPPEYSSIKAFFMSKIFGMAINTEGIDEYFNNFIDQFEWETDLVNISAEYDKKLEVMSMYTTQIESFGGMEFIEKLLEKYYDLWNNCEPYWYIKK